jgi:hypothetical protein
MNVKIALILAICTPVIAWGSSVFVREAGDDWLSRIGHGIMALLLVAVYVLSWFAVIYLYAR